MILVFLTYILGEGKKLELEGEIISWIIFDYQEFSDT